MDQGFFSRGLRRAARIDPDQFADVWVPSTSPQVTVLFPMYRQDAFVAEALTSILEQCDIPCEILVCDDASPGKTFTIALETISQFLARTTSDGHELIHTVRVRRNSRTLGRMNVHAMAAEAACDILVQAHGDDISAPTRMRRIADAFADPSVKLVASSMRVMDALGTHDESATITAPEGFFSVTTALDRPPWLIGAGLAWHESLLAEGIPLVLENTPVAHDRIMGLRAALRGGAYTLADELVVRRLHDEQWLHNLTDPSSQPTRAHGWAVQKSMMFGAMMDEIRAAEAGGTISSAEATEYLANCRAELDACNRDMRKYAGQLIGDGRHLVWK